MKTMKSGKEEVLELLSALIEALVDHPEAVGVTAIEASQLTMLEVVVGKGDVGKVVGRKGRTATAIRTLLAAASGRNGHRYTLELVEPGDYPVVLRRREVRIHFEQNPTEITRGLLVQIARQLVDHSEAVRVKAIEGSQAVVFELHTDLDDVRRVIGRRGATAAAARELLLNLGSRVGKRYLLEIVEPIERVG